MGKICYRCGARCDGDSAICVVCGAAIAGSPGTTPTPPPPQITPVPAAPGSGGFFHSHWLALLMGVVVLLLFVAAAVLYSYISSPKRLAERYFRSLCSGDWAGAYGMLDLDRDIEGDFISESLFATVMSGRTTVNYGDVVSYEISLSRSDDAAGRYSYTIQFITDDAEVGALAVDLQDTGEKQFLIFPDYQVATDRMIDDFIISAPAYASVTLDGVALDPASGALDETGEIRVYTIDAVFRCVHQVGAQHPLLSPYAETATDALEITPEDMPLLPEIQDLVQSQAIADGNLMIAAACEGSTLENKTLSADYTTYYYNWFYNREPTGMHDVAVTGGEVTGMNTTLPTAMTVACTVHYTYNYNDYDGALEYDKIADRWVQVYDATPAKGEFQTTLTYAYADGAWQLSDIA